MIRIATLLTCHNRCSKTLKSLNSLLNSISYYNSTNKEQIMIEVFLTDDGCTDNTVKEVKCEIAPLIKVNIIKGDGNCFWAGGMRYAWKVAQKGKWDFYLLLNDDTVVFEELFNELLKTHEFSLKEFGKEGLYSGITCEPGNKEIITYGGDIWTNKFLCKTKRLHPSGYPQMCDMTNANILLVPQTVVDQIGIFNEKYTHGMADYDYSMEARRNNIPLLVTSNVCGACENDHPDIDVVTKVCSMTLKERKVLFKSPLHSSDDYLFFVRRFLPLRYPIVWLGRKLIVYLPHLYNILYKLRVK